MNFSVRVAGLSRGLADRMRAVSQAARGEEAGRSLVVALPSTSSISDPEEIAALSRFGEPLSIGR